MKYLMIINIITLQSLIVNSQSIWYFGGQGMNSGTINGAGIDFTSGVPTALTNSGLGFSEATAVRTNESGELLFYTDGVNILNKNHEIMSNGENIGGHISSQQSSVIIPIPCNPEQYYVFANDGVETANGTGLYYSIVDMSLKAEEVAVISKKNSLLIGTNEHLTATMNEDNSGYWVVTSKQTNEGCYLYAYEITSYGISSPVISDLGLKKGPHTSSFKFNPSGNLMAMKLSDESNKAPLNGDRTLVKFNQKTGYFSDPICIHFGSGTNTGCEFSADGKLLYSANHEYGGLSNIYQYDLTAENIAASRIQVGFSPQQVSDMKLGPDGKIYISCGFSSVNDFIGTIEHPEIRGLGCVYQFNSFSLNGRKTGISFPNVHLPLLNLNCTSTFSNLFIPNSFSPNGDGINDYFNVSLNGYDEISISIYDNYGTLVFLDFGQNIIWNGKNKHGKLIHGTVVYQLEYNISNGENQVIRGFQKGNISIVQ